MALAFVRTSKEATLCPISLSSRELAPFVWHAFRLTTHWIPNVIPDWDDLISTIPFENVPVIQRKNPFGDESVFIRFGTNQRAVLFNLKEEVFNNLDNTKRIFKKSMKNNFMWNFSWSLYSSSIFCGYFVHFVFLVSCLKLTWNVKKWQGFADSGKHILWQDYRTPSFSKYMFCWA